MNVMLLVMSAVQFGLQGIGYLIAAAGIVGAVMAGTTRGDAYDAAGRQAKGVWVGLLAVASLCVAIQFPYLNWIGVIIIGLYWFDLRPELQDLVQGRNRF